MIHIALFNTTVNSTAVSDTITSCTVSDDFTTTFSEIAKQTYDPLVLVATKRLQYLLFLESNRDTIVRLAQERQSEILPEIRKRNVGVSNIIERC